MLPHFGKRCLARDLVTWSQPTQENSPGIINRILLKRFISVPIAFSIHGWLPGGDRLLEVIKYTISLLEVHFEWFVY